MQEINPASLEFSTYAEYAALTKKSIKTIYTDVSLGRGHHPPIYRATPSARPLFVNARSWLAEQVQRSLEAVDAAHPAPTSSSSAQTSAGDHHKKRGRPSNLTRLAAKKGEV